MPLSSAQRCPNVDLSSDMVEIHAGLSQEQKSISPKFFYDDEGSRLFDAICELPEYYPTRTELQILQSKAHQISALIGENASLIEYGSGSSLKTRVLLTHLQHLAAYVPVDISRDHLFSAASRIRTDFPNIEVLPVIADFTRPFRLPSPETMPVRNIIFFPGSTIGNFSRDSACELMKIMYQEAGNDGALLIGVDLQKDRTILEPAYNDSQGVTEAFNRNLLCHLNSEYGGSFDVGAFSHRAVYNEDEGRIEMYLDSRADQVATIGGREFSIRKGEPILTEHSYKYTLEGFNDLAEAAGFHVHKVWVDQRRLFSVQYCLRV